MERRLRLAVESQLDCETFAAAISTSTVNFKATASALAFFVACDFGAGFDAPLDQPAGAEEPRDVADGFEEPRDPTFEVIGAFEASV